MKTGKGPVGTGCYQPNRRGDNPAAIPSCRDHSRMNRARRQDPDREPLFTQDGKVCAVIVGGALTKAIRGSVHMLRRPRAIALDVGAVEAAEARGISPVAVTDHETRTVYRTTITELYRHGWRFNRGWGTQIAMRLERWQRDGDEPERQPEQPKCDRGSLQLALL